jgi:DNA polymerase-3 subunit delta
MWLSNRRIFLAFGGAFVAGCALQPANQMQSVDRILSAITLETPRDRRSFYFRNALADRLGASDPAPRYGLSYQLSTAASRSAIAPDGRSLRQQVEGSVTFMLRDLTNNTVVYTQSRRAFVLWCGMKLNGRDISALVAKPDDRTPAVLFYGADAMRVALKREEYLKNLLGPNADEEMRLARFSASELKKEPAMLQDALKAQGFFPGQRAVFIEEAADAVSKIVMDGIDASEAGDATIVVTAGQLKPSSSLRKGFEGHSSAKCAPIYDNPPTRAEIEADLKKAGLAHVPMDAMDTLNALARDLEPGDFRQTLEKLALYKYGDYTAVSTQDIEACAPTSAEAELDDILNIVASGRADQIGPVMKRLKDQGMQPVTLTIGAARHFKTLFSAASDPGGAANGVGKLRPPVYGPRRDMIVHQAQQWGGRKLQEALTVLTDLDLQLRSAGQRAPAMELVERSLIRLAMMARR